MDHHFGGIIWTDHALERLKARGIKQGDAWATWRNPQQSRKGKKQETWVYYRTWGDREIEVVATRNENKEWVILSVWDRLLTTPKKPPANFRISSQTFLQRLFSKLFLKKKVEEETSRKHPSP